MTRFKSWGGKAATGTQDYTVKPASIHMKTRPFGKFSKGGGDLALHLITGIHPNLRNINPHNVTHSLISPNAREQMLVVQISLLIVTFPSLLS